MSNHCHKLNAVAFGLSLGIVWGVACFLIALFAMNGYAADFVKTVGSFYIGFRATFWGAVLGFIWGFVDFFIFGVVVAWLYNLFCGGKCEQTS